MTKAQAAVILGKRLHDSTAANIAKIKEDLDESLRIILSEAETWDFMERSHQFMTIADRHEYTLDAAEVGGVGKTDIRRFIWIRDEGRQVRLNPITTDQYEEWYTDPLAFTGTPRDFNMWNGKLLIGPTPNGATLLKYRYYMKAPTMADGDSPPWVAHPAGDEWDHVWMQGAYAMGLNFNDDAREGREWSKFFRGVAKMKGDNPMVEEDIVLSGFSQRNYNWQERSHLV